MGYEEVWRGSGRFLRDPVALRARQQLARWSVDEGRGSTSNRDEETKQLLKGVQVDVVLEYH